MFRKTYYVLLTIQDLKQTEERAEAKDKRTQLIFIFTNVTQNYD